MLEMMLGGKQKVAGVSYADFLTWMNQNSGKMTELSLTGTPSTRTGYLKVQLTAAFQGTMWGSPYKTYYTYDSVVNRIIQHALPSAAAGSEAVSAKRYMLFKNTYVSTRSSYLGVNRNGYSSPSYTSYQGGYCDDFIYYDTTTGIVMRYNPLTDSTPVPFDLTISA